MDVPPLDNSAMDGYAVRLSDLGSSKKLRIAQKIMAGSGGKPLETGAAARIFPRAPIPPGAGAGGMQEQSEAQGDFLVVKKKPPTGQRIPLARRDPEKGRG